MRHLWVGEPCPIDAAPVSRTHCSECPAFVSYRSAQGGATIGCSWGEDVAGWLRREMATGGAHRRAAAGRRSAGPRAPRRRPRLAPGTSFGLFVAALGVGLALSAFEPAE